MSPSPLERLKQIRDECEFLSRAIGAADLASFLESGVLLRAAERSFTITGEAVKAVPEEIRQQAPDVKWREAWKMRDFLSHVYFHVNATILWETVRDDVPPLLDGVSALIDRLGPENINASDQQT